LRASLNDCAAAIADAGLIGEVFMKNSIVIKDGE